MKTRCACPSISLSRFLTIGGLGTGGGIAAILALCTAVNCGFADTQPSDEPSDLQEERQFERVNRPNSVNIEEAYNLGGIAIPTDEIHTLLPKDAIPALDNPSTVPASDVDFLLPTDRVLVYENDNFAIAAPLRVLNYHEIVNTTVGDEKVVLTYCPLCDSAAVFSREVRGTDGRMMELNFGVSGALYNSNVLMYDRETEGLWSQLAMESVSGPLVGRKLTALPFRVIPFEKFQRFYPSQPVVSFDTGHPRGYHQDPYAQYFQVDTLLVPLRWTSKDLPTKTLGVGLVSGALSYFIPIEEIPVGEVYSFNINTSRLEVARTEAGIDLLNMSRGFRAVQTFWYSWAAFYPQTQILWPQGEPTVLLQDDEPEGDGADGNEAGSDEPAE